MTHYTATPEARLRALLDEISTRLGSHCGSLSGPLPIDVRSVAEAREWDEGLVEEIFLAAAQAVDHAPPDYQAEPEIWLAVEALVDARIESGQVYAIALSREMPVDRLEAATGYLDQMIDGERDEQARELRNVRALLVGRRGGR